MKRSQLNQIIENSIELMNTHHFCLPPFAYWRLPDWAKEKGACAEIFTAQLGWDITDFGSGDFDAVGLVLFTLRNGNPENWINRAGKCYAEKIMVSQVGQVTPMHFHWTKMEDIINRGGGRLMLEVFKANQDELLSNEEFVLSIDGKEIHCQPGTRISLAPGQSVTFPPRIYHSFWAIDAPVLIGEVSLVNDDLRDNRFLEAVGRFPSVLEDEEPAYLLVGDYENYL